MSKSKEKKRRAERAKQRRESLPWLSKSNQKPSSDENQSSEAQRQ